MDWRPRLPNDLGASAANPLADLVKYKEMKKFSARLVNGPQQIWRGSTVAYLHLQKWL